MITVEEGGSGFVLSATSKGYGKRTRLNDFPPKRRGGQGVIAIRDGERNGTAVCIYASPVHLTPPRGSQQT